jgi:hypothetical protein
LLLVLLTVAIVLFSKDYQSNTGVIGSEDSCCLFGLVQFWYNTKTAVDIASVSGGFPPFAVPRHCF